MSFHLPDKERHPGVGIKRVSIINALMFWLAASISPGFHVANFSAAFWGALVFWIVSWLTNWLIFAE